MKRTDMTLASLIASAALFASPLSAQDAEPPATTAPDKAPATEAEQPVQPDEDDMLGDLDDLLGLDGDTGASGTPQGDAGDPAENELERVLTGAEIGDAFVEAVDMMGDVAGRIEDRRDTSLRTQRLQEDIIRRLDQLIDSINQQQGQQSSSSSSSQRQQQQQQQQPKQQQGERTEAAGDSSDSSDAPPGQTGELRPDLDAATSQWGDLPERIRDELLQGISDRFSAHYKRMTEAYYRSLAERTTGER